MSTEQKLFNKIMEWQLYPATTGITGSTDFMDVAIKVAYQSGLITKEAGTQALNAINEYIKHSDTLFIFLHENEQKSDLIDQIAIYQNWDNRPLK